MTDVTGSSDPVDDERAPWRRRDFRLAWGAGFVNDAGDWVLLVALPLYVFTETGSGAATAGLFVAQLLVGAFLGPLGGSLVDRWNLRRCLIATNLLQAVALLPLLALDSERLWLAYIVMAAQAVLTQINNPANVALLPRLVGRHEIATANAALSASGSLARLLGAPIGGIAVAWGGIAPIVAIDATSFLAAAAAIWAIRTPTPVLRVDDLDGGRSVRTGIRAVRANPPLTALIWLHGASQVAQGMFVVLFVVFVVDTLGDDGSGLGVIRGTMAIGAVAGAALIARISIRVESTTLFAVGLIGMGVVSLAFWNAPSVTTALWVYLVLFSLSGIPGASVSVGLITTVQTRSPPAAIGRVAGLTTSLAAVGAAMGSILAGLMIDRVPLWALLDAEATVYLTTGALALALMVPRHRRRPFGARHPPPPSCTG